jgi:hypothetical protein
MEDKKKLIAISYCCIFLSIYFLFIAYASFSPLISESLSIEMPTTITVNATSSAISSFSSFTGGLWGIGIIAFILMIIMYIISHQAMGAAL